MGINEAIRSYKRREVSILYWLQKTLVMKMKGKYPIPTMHGCINTLGDVEYFTTLDGYSWY